MPYDRPVAENKLYVIPGSHPSLAASLMLERKGVPFKRVDMIPGPIKQLQIRAMGFPNDTVPALKLDGEKLQGSREISRELDRRFPELPLFPTDAKDRSAVEEAERWGDEELQAVPRRITWWAIRRNSRAAGSFLAGARIGLPIPVAVRTVGPIAWASAKLNKADDANVRADLAGLPALLDRIDGLIEEGVIGGEEPNAADYQIAPSVRLLLCLEDLRPLLEGRPAAKLARRLVPDFPGDVPRVLPPEWLPAAEAQSAAR